MTVADRGSRLLVSHSVSLPAVMAERPAPRDRSTRAGPNLDVLKLTAVVAMTADHVGVILFDRSFLWLTLIGRLAFPLFAFLVAYNATFHTRSRGRYVARLLLFAALSQPAYVLALSYPGSVRLNIFATLATGLVALCLATTRVRAALAVTALLLAWVTLEARTGSSLMSFGFPGALLVLAFGLRLRWKTSWSTALVVFSLVLLSSDGGDLGYDLPRALARAASLPLIAFSSCLTWSPAWPRPTKWLFYVYYPLHLLLLLLIWNLWL